MHIIIAYDVETKRTEIFKKICQIYLVRIQNSVFEGDITEPQFMKLKDRLENEIKEEETVIIWITSKILKTVQLGARKGIESGII
ncbi:MAG: CRISPR-associated endonuclease Cas2 [Cuniculiplasma sp.]